MAISGKFQADFTSFYDAVAKAEVSLRGFDASTGKVESSLNRMVDNFGGRKIITEATLMAQAVEKIGGVAHLTDAELARIGNTAAEAAAKFRAYGQEIPKNIQDLASHAKSATDSFSSMKGVVTDLAVGFAAMFSIRAAVNFVSGVLDQASALVDLSQQTHISIEDIQRLAGAMSEFGVDQDTLAKGLFTLSRKIAGGDDSVAKALHLMGLSLQDVQGLEGEALFLEMEHGLAKLQGGLRDTTASELFGSRLGMAMAGAAEGIDGAMDSAKRMTVVSTEAALEMDKYSESIARAQKSLSAMAANMIGPVAQGFNVLNDAAVKGASKWDIFKAMFVDFTNSGLRVGASTSALTTLLDHQNQETMKVTVSTTRAAVAHTAFVGPLQATAAQLKAVSAAARDLATAHTKAVDEAKKHGEALAKVTGEVNKLEGGLFLIPESLAKIGRGFDESKLGPLAEAVGKVEQNARILNFGFEGMVDELSKVGKAGENTAMEIERLGAAFDFTGPINQVTVLTTTLTSELGKVPDIFVHAFEGGGGVSGALKAIAVQLGADFAKSLNQSIKISLESSGSGFSALSVKAAGATGAVAGLGAAMSGASGKAAAASAAMAGVSVAAGAIGTGATIGGAVALGAATAGIGLAAVGAYLLIKHFLTNTEKAINPVRQGFVDAAGGLDALNAHAHAAGLTLDKLLNAKNVKDYNAAVTELTTAFAIWDGKVAAATLGVQAIVEASNDAGVRIPEALKGPIQAWIDMGLVTGETAAAFASLAGQTEVDFKKMEATAQKYGIDLAALGPAFQSAKLHDAAKTIINDFDSLVKNGADADAVLHGMSGSIGKLVKDSLQFGVAIPENMRPWVEQLALTHQLIGDNGEEITDLSGLKFAPPIVSEFDKIVQKLQELIDKIGASTKAINAIPDNKTIHVGYQYDPYDPPVQDGGAGFAGGGVVHGFSEGGPVYAAMGKVIPFKPRGTDTVPAMLTPGERVLTRSQNAAYESGGGSNAGGASVEGLRQDMARHMAALPATLARAVRDEVQKVSRRR